VRKNDRLFSGYCRIARDLVITRPRPIEVEQRVFRRLAQQLCKPLCSQHNMAWAAEEGGDEGLQSRDVHQAGTVKGSSESPLRDLDAMPEASKIKASQDVDATSSPGDSHCESQSLSPAQSRPGRFEEPRLWGHRGWDVWNYRFVVKASAGGLWKLIESGGKWASKFPTEPVCPCLEDYPLDSCGTSFEGNPNPDLLQPWAPWKDGGPIATSMSGSRRSMTIGF
jgi:hypothetical protein